MTRAVSKAGQMQAHQPEQATWWGAAPGWWRCWLATQRCNNQICIGHLLLVHGLLLAAWNIINFYRLSAELVFNSVCISHVCHTVMWCSFYLFLGLGLLLCRHELLCALATDCCNRTYYTCLFTICDLNQACSSLATWSLKLNCD